MTVGLQPNILFAGVGRIRDQLVLASVFERINSAEKHEIESSFQTYLTEAASRFSPGSRDKRSLSEGTMFLLADRELCCVYAVGIRGRSYPERVAYAFLGEFIGIVAQLEDARALNIVSQPGALSKQARKPLKDLMERYEKPGSVDKTSDVRGKVDHVKGIMQDNINKVIATHANIQDLEAKTDDLSQNAAQFNRTAGDLRRVMWWQKTKMTILLGLVIGAVIAYIIIIIINMIE